MCDLDFCPSRFRERLNEKCKRQAKSRSVGRNHEGVCKRQRAAERTYLEKCINCCR